MAGFITAEGLVVPAGADTYDYVNDQRRLAGSIRSVVPVANPAGANNVISAMATDGRPVSDTNPLVVWDQSVHKILTYNASGVSYGLATEPHTEFTTAANTAAPNSAWGMGVFTNDAANTTDTGFVTINATDKLQIRDAGIYTVTVMVSFTAAISGVSWLSVDGQYTTTMGGGLQNFITTMPNIRYGAGALLVPQLAHGSAGNMTFTSRVRVTRHS